MSSVAASRTFLFFMSQSIFDSKWCLKELTQACRYKRDIILVVESGCTWITPEGRATSFPDFLFSVRSTHGLLSQTLATDRFLYCCKRFTHAVTLFRFLCLVRRTRSR